MSSDMSKINISRIDSFNDSILRTQDARDFIEEALKANQADASLKKLQDEAEDNSAMGIQVKTKRLEKDQKLKSEKAKRVQESVLVRKDDADGLADGFARRQGNREYRMNPSLLSQLAENIGIGIHEKSQPEDLIFFIRNEMTTVDGEIPDCAILDKAFEFLLEVTKNQLTQAEGTVKERFEGIQKQLETAQSKHFEKNAAEIQVTRKIIGAVDAVVETTGQTVKETLVHYRDIVHNPTELQTLWKYYLEKFKGNDQEIYDRIDKELSGLSTYLGGHFKRSNMESPELAQLASAVKKMQAIRGGHRQATLEKNTMKIFVRLILEKAMNLNAFESRISAHLLTKLFFEFADERYPSSEKMKQACGEIADLIASNDLEKVYLQIGLLNAMRNMVKEVSPSQFYRSMQHLDDLYAAIIEALEELEDKFEELEDKLSAEEAEELEEDEEG